MDEALALVDIEQCSTTEAFNTTEYTHLHMMHILLATKKLLSINLAWRVQAFDMKKSISLVVLASSASCYGLVFATSALQSSYEGTLTCQAAQMGPIEPAFSAPVVLKVEGSKVTWTRETPAMREVVTGELERDQVELEGHGGSVSAATRQAFWDWKFKGRLLFTDGAFTGNVELLTKDGRTVQRRCTFATAGRAASLPAAAAQTAPAPAPASTPAPVPTPPSPVAAPQATPVQVSPAPAQPPVIPDAGSAAREEELRAREAALARREQSVSRRERALTQAPKPVAPPPAPKAAQPAAPPPAAVAAPAAPAKPSSPAALGDI